MNRPSFDEFESYEEFKKYYWYREELIHICKNLNINSTGTKLDLNYSVEQYFKGNMVKPKKIVKRIKPTTEILTLDTTLVESGFCFNQKFRDFFMEQTGVTNFKFNADMVATAKKVRQENDVDFTLQDMLDIYYEKKEYAKFDSSSCEWNLFLKDFCADEQNQHYQNKLKAAASLWKFVRESTLPKVYTHSLIEMYQAAFISDDKTLKE